MPNDTLKIESCGLDLDQSVFPPNEAVQAATKFGVDLGNHRSNGLHDRNFTDVDIVIPMQYVQWRRLIAMSPENRDKIVLLRDFASFPDNLICNIYDPYGQGQEQFNRCFGLMEKALKGLMRRIGAD